jgi:hypothetical protein
MPIGFRRFRRGKPALPLLHAICFSLILILPVSLLPSPFRPTTPGPVTLAPKPALLVPAPQRRSSRPSAIEQPCIFTGVRKIVAIGDLHGAYEPFVEILQGLRIIDDRLRWIAGTTHLVQMGDIMDRGTKARDILDLIRRLEVEARAAGGAVHLLLGNHEEMTVLGLSFELKGYVTPEQFRDFLPPLLRELKEREFRIQAGPTADLDPLWEAYMEESSEARNAYTAYFNDRYGNWLAAHPVVIKINDLVFVHGGLSEALSVQPCQVINAGFSGEIKRALRGEAFNPTWLYRTDGPLWYRDLATKPEDTLREEIDRILANLGAVAIVIGHTPTPASISLVGASRLGGKIWVVDTGIWIKEGGRKSALMMENGRIRMTPGRIEDEGGHK